LGDSIPVDFSTFDGCDQPSPKSFPSGTSLMLLRDSQRAPTYGAGVGDSEARVLALYQGRIRVEPHKYTGPEGHYLVVSRPADTLYLIIFETDGKRVERYRAGRRPAVEFVEGCA
jgi:hypothetical protein